MSVIRRTAQVVAIVGTLLIGVLAVALIVSQTPWFKDWVRRYIVRESKQYLNGELTIGHLGGNLFFATELADVAVDISGELEVNGFEPVTVSDGPSGLALARQLRPDLILVDVMMPGMSGIEVCKTIRSDPELRDTPIITITALTDKRIESKALEAGATLALQKPHDAHRLIEAIKAALGTRRRAAGSA